MYDVRSTRYDDIDELNMISLKKILTLFLFFYFSNNALCQNIGLSYSKINTARSRSAPPLHEESLGQYKSNFFKNKTQNIVYQSFKHKDLSKPNTIPLVFSVEKLPFFCKIEYKMGLDKRLPLKFRLGDVQYVDALEGKNNGSRF